MNVLDSPEQVRAVLGSPYLVTQSGAWLFAATPEQVDFSGGSVSVLTTGSPYARTTRGLSPNASKAAVRATYSGVNCFKVINGTQEQCTYAYLDGTINRATSWVYDANNLSSALFMFVSAARPPAR